VPGRVPDGVANGLCRALLDPQQPRDAPVLGLAGALAGEREAEQLGQVVLGVGAGQALRAGLQVAALLVQENS
jgi:hypothetical protein